MAVFLSGARQYWLHKRVALLAGATRQRLGTEFCHPKKNTRAWILGEHIGDRGLLMKAVKAGSNFNSGLQPGSMTPYRQVWSQGWAEPTARN